MAIGTIALLLAEQAGTLHGLHGTDIPLWHAGLYALWAMLQEFLLQSFIFVRFQTAFGSPRAILCTACLFSAAHLPNLVLMAATFAMGLSFTYLFWRYRNIYTLGTAHALLGLSLAVSLPNAITHYMHVGAAFWT
jgi:membrane protease YdiL (CAAX protease family)